MSRSARCCSGNGLEPGTVLNQQERSYRVFTLRAIDTPPPAPAPAWTFTCRHRRPAPYQNPAGFLACRQLRRRRNRCAVGVGPATPPAGIDDASRPRAVVHLPGEDTHDQAVAMLRHPHRGRSEKASASRRESAHHLPTPADLLAARRRADLRVRREAPPASPLTGTVGAPAVASRSPPQPTRPADLLAAGRSPWETLVDADLAVEYIGCTLAEAPMRPRHASSPASVDLDGAPTAAGSRRAGSGGSISRGRAEAQAGRRRTRQNLSTPCGRSLARFRFILPRWPNWAIEVHPLAHAKSLLRTHYIIRVHQLYELVDAGWLGLTHPDR